MYKFKWKKIHILKFDKDDVSFERKLRNVLSNKYAIKRYTERSINGKDYVNIFLKHINSINISIVKDMTIKIEATLKHNDIILIDKKGNIIGIERFDFINKYFKEIKND